MVKFTFATSCLRSLSTPTLSDFLLCSCRLLLVLMFEKDVPVMAETVGIAITYMPTLLLWWDRNWMGMFNECQSNRRLEFQNLALSIVNSLKSTWDLIPPCCCYASKYSQSSSRSDFMTSCAHFSASWQSQRHPLPVERDNGWSWESWMRWAG